MAHEGYERALDCALDWHHRGRTRRLGHTTVEDESPAAIAGSHRSGEERERHSCVPHRNAREWVPASTTEASRSRSAPRSDEARRRARRRGLATSRPEGEARASGDAAFDAAFEVHAASAAAVGEVLHGDVRRARLAKPDLETFEWDGARWSITLRGKSWERGRALVEQVASRA